MMREAREARSSCVTRGCNIHQQRAAEWYVLLQQISANPCETPRNPARTSTTRARHDARGARGQIILCAAMLQHPPAARLPRWRIFPRQISASPCIPSRNPARTSTTRPSTMREAGEARSSRAPCSVASVRNAAAVSKLIFRNGERLQSMPARLHARYPP